MKKEKVYIVVNHLHRVNKDGDWDTSEKVEFVDQLRRRHLDQSSIVADYINRKVLVGARFGFDTYEKVDAYVRKRYDKQMAELDRQYQADQVPDTTEKVETVMDDFGQVRAKTVFDV